MPHPSFRFLLPAAVLTLAGLAAGPSVLHAQGPQTASSRRPTANARRLVALSRQALGETALTAARLHGPRYEPFWATFDEMARSLERIGTAMRARDPRLFGEIRTGTRALEALSTVWRRTGAESDAVSARLDAFAVSYRLLRSQYGGEALRARQGGELTEAENRQLALWQQTQGRLAVRLTALQAEAARRQDHEMQEEMRRLAERARRIAEAQPTLVTYLETIQINDEMQGEWDGNSYYVQSADAPAWEEAYEVVEDLSTGDQPGFVIAADLSSGQTWSFLETATEIPADLGFAAELDQERGPGPAQAYVLEAPAEPEASAASDAEILEDAAAEEPEEVWAATDLAGDEHGEVETVEVHQPEEAGFEETSEDAETVEITAEAKTGSLEGEPAVLAPAAADAAGAAEAVSGPEKAGEEHAEPAMPGAASEAQSVPETATGEDISVVEDIDVVIDDAPAGEEPPPHPYPHD